MTERPSIADDFLEGTYRFVKNSVPNRWRGDAEKMMIKYRSSLRRAVRFGVEPDLVDLVTELSMRTQPEALLRRMGSAILPYETTWIEFDLHRKVRTSARVAGKVPNFKDVPERCGLLLERDPSRGTRWAMTIVADMKGSVSEGITMAHPAIWIFDSTGSVGSMLGYPTKAIQFSEGSPRWVEGACWGYSTLRQSKGEDEIKEHDIDTIILPDMLRGYTNFSISHLHQMLIRLMPKTMDPKVAKDGLAKDFLTDIHQNIGMLRWAVTLLAVLSEVPVLKAPPSVFPGSRMLGNLPRSYMDFHRLSVKLPKTKAVPYVERKLDRAEAARRRAHDVRSHWRTYLNAGPRCEHDWVYNEEDRRICSKCQGRSKLIHEHVRGDVSLGWVKKDYVLETR